MSESKSKRVTLKKKYKVIRKVKEHHKKKAKEAKKLGLNRKQKIEKDPGIPNDWPFREQELQALEARRARHLEEIEQKKAARKERVFLVIYNHPRLIFSLASKFMLNKVCLDCKSVCFIFFSFRPKRGSWVCWKIMMVIMVMMQLRL